MYKTSKFIILFKQLKKCNMNKVCIFFCSCYCCPQNCFFVLENIILKLGTLMCYGFLINIFRNDFFSKQIFFDSLTLL